MRIDRTHKSWLIASLAILGVSALVYGIYRVPGSRGPMGGTTAGLAFGVLGFAFMIFAALLGARKKVPVWRIGRAQTWMRGHLWLGLLSLPLIVFHSGFQYGHGLTALLMTLLIIVVVSGLVGAVLQHYMPRMMTRELTLETIYEEIDHVRAQLREEAEEIVARVMPAPQAVPVADAPAVAASSAPAVATAAQVATAGPPAISEEVVLPLRNFFDQELKPFLASPAAHGQALGDAARAKNVFAQLRTLLPPAMHDTLEDLEGICEEERQLSRQARMHLWLHGWLLVHIPLSLALILLGAVHAVMALRY